MFVRSGEMWSQQAYLKASNTDAGDWFGYSVAISGDTVVVGAAFEGSSATGVNGNQDDNNAAGAGAAHVFARDGGVWSQQAYLKASNTNSGDRFGWSVAISDDTVVVGAVVEESSATGVDGDQGDNRAPDAGAAYVFTITTEGTVSPTVGGIVSSASFVPTAPAAPGSILAVFGQNFGMLNDGFLFPSTQFAAEGVSVLFDGSAAPLFGVFGQTPFPQINVLAPTDLPEMGQVQVEVTNSAGISDMFILQMAPASTGIYRADPLGRMSAAALVAFDSDVPDRGPTRHLAIPASTAATLGIPTNCKAYQINAFVPLGAQAGDQVPLTIRMPSEMQGDTSNIAIAAP